MNKKILTLCSVMLLVICLTICLCACAPSTAESGQKKMEKAGYDVKVLSNAEVNLMFATNLNAQKSIVASKNDEKVVAIWFDSKDDAKYLLDTVNRYGDSFIKKTFGDNMKYGVKSKVFYIGTSGAIKVLF